jgi:hypothetical protein
VSEGLCQDVSNVALLHAESLVGTQKMVGVYDGTRQPQRRCYRPSSHHALTPASAKSNRWRQKLATASNSLRLWHHRPGWQSVGMQNQHNAQENYQLALKYHQQLPDRIREYLNRRGIPEQIICRYRIGWNGDHITIPVTDRDRKVVFFKLARDPENLDGPEMIASPGAYAELYGWERLAFKRDQLVICEGEFDRLILEARGFAAVTSTAGALFPIDWSEPITDVPKVYICYRNDPESYNRAGSVAALIPQSRIVILPEEVGLGGKIEDYFIRLGKSAEDFQALLESATSSAEGLHQQNLPLR